MRYGDSGDWGAAHPMFELGEGLFDGVQVRPVGRQVQQVRNCGADCLQIAAFSKPDLNVRGINDSVAQVA